MHYSQASQKLQNYDYYQHTFSNLHILLFGQLQLLLNEYKFGIH